MSFGPLAFPDLTAPLCLTCARSLKWRGAFSATEYSAIRVAICTAYSDYTWQQMLEKLTRPGQFLVLGKPFESTAVRQIAMALTEKWNLARAAERSRDELELMVKDRTRELEAANARLEVQMNERIELERRLQHAQKLEALGRLVAGVAHEINNPLSYVLASLGHLDEELRRMKNGDADAARELCEAVSEARAGGKRIQQIVQDLTTFSRPDKSGLENVMVEDVVRFALRMAGPSFPTETRIDEQFQPVPVVRANPGLLSQVFVNLLANAAQAIGGGRAGENEIRVTGRVEDGRVIVEVADTGCGIAPDDLKRVFDPFFTTKPAGTGTGLGLSVCNSIVAAVGGSIEVHVRVDDIVYSVLSIAEGATLSNVVSGFGKAPLRQGSKLGVDIVSVPQSSGQLPGRDLTVTIRL